MKYCKVCEEHQGNESQHSKHSTQGGEDRIGSTGEADPKQPQVRVTSSEVGRSGTIEAEERSIILNEIHNKQRQRQDEEWDKSY